MQINPTELGDLQEGGGNDLSVGNDDDAVGCEPLQQIARFRRADFFRLMHGDICRYGRFLRRRRGDLPASTAWAVGLRDYSSDFDIGLSEELDEGRDGEVRGTAEEDAHGLVRGRHRNDREASLRADILPSWGAVLRPYKDGTLAHATTTRLACGAF